MPRTPARKREEEEAAASSKRQKMSPVELAKQAARGRQNESVTEKIKRAKSPDELTRERAVARSMSPVDRAKAAARKFQGEVVAKKTQKPAAPVPEPSFKFGGAAADARSASPPSTKKALAKKPSAPASPAPPRPKFSKGDIVDYAKNGQSPERALVTQVDLDGASEHYYTVELVESGREVQTVAKHLSAQTRRRPGLALKGSFRQAALKTSDATGCSKAAAAVCLFAALVALAAVAANQLGPAAVLGLFGLINLSDTLPACDGTQFIFQCECPPGYESDGATWGQILGRAHCTSCDLNEFKPGRGNVECQPCPSWSHRAEGMAECRDCPAGSTRLAPDGRTVGPTCEPCPANTFFAGPAGCKACSAVEFQSKPGSGRCKPCPAGSTRLAPDGRTLGAVCEPCPANTFLDGEGRCVECPVDTESHAGAAAAGAASCVACREGSVRGLGSRGPCVACERNTFKGPSDRSGACTACNRFEFTRGAGEAAPRCLPGAARDAKGGRCQACPPLTFKAGVGDGPCEAVSGNRVPNAEATGQVLDTSYEGFLTKTNSRGGLLKRVQYFFLRLFTAHHTMATVATSINEAFHMLLESLIKLLWGGKEAFQAAWDSDGGSANTSTLRSAEEAWAAKEAFGGGDCPFADRPAVVAFVKATPEFQALQAAHGRGDTAGKRQASRALMLAFHPDKFHALYRACDKDLSYDAWTEIATYR